jgi:hypothetical protein
VFTQGMTVELIGFGAPQTIEVDPGAQEVSF